MKKIIFFLPICILIAGILLENSAMKQGNREIREQARYFYEINKIIRDLDFNTADMQDGKIVLYDNNSEEISRIEFLEYDESKEFIYAYKMNGKIYFVTDKQGNDESGIMVVNDDSDRMMNGVGSAERIGDNSYQYTTFCDYFR